MSLFDKLKKFEKKVVSEPLTPENENIAFKPILEQNEISVVENTEKQKTKPKTPEKSILNEDLDSIHMETLNDDVRILLENSEKWIMTRITDKTNKRVLSGNLGMLKVKDYGNMREKEIYKTYANLFTELSKKNE